MLNFCTLFDINFISQGLSMYESLKRHCTANFILYIFAFCDESYNFLKSLNLDNVKVISLDELEKGIPALKEAKKDRTKGEYCWTCASASIKYCIEKFNLNQCTYLDSDIYFYSDPKILLDKMKDKSVLITEHRYTPEYDQTATSGKYCVQFISFKNDVNGIKVLNWWVDRCIEWCYARFEEGRFGDQKYLDDWTERFEGIYVLEHLGGGVAPWNIQQYEIYEKDNKIILNNNIPLVFYHFHNIKVLNNGYLNANRFNAYKIDKQIKSLIYKPYLKTLSQKSEKLNKLNKNILVIRNKLPNTDINIKELIKETRKKIIQIKFGKNKRLVLFGKQIY